MSGKIESIVYALPYRYHKPYEGVKIEGEDMLELDGYCDTETLVKEFLVAGENLSNWRQQMYDWDDEEGSESDYDSFNAPERSPDYDLADAQEDLERLHARIYKRKRSREKSSVHSEDVEVSGRGDSVLPPESSVQGAKE